MSPRLWAKALLLFLLNLGLNWPILLSGVTPYRGSIERGYAYMARIFADNPDYLSWNPLQYGGIPMHYVYLPLLPYFDAFWLWVIPGADATHVHRAVCALALMATPAAAYLFVAGWTGRVRASFASALAVTFFSPLYALVETIAGDRGFMTVPWRIQVLIKYGEGPHTVGILFLLIALFLVHRAAMRPGFAPLVAAACALAATVLTNWVAGLALAFAVLMLMLVHWGDTAFQHRRILYAGLLGYLLSAFWLTPSFIAQMAHNWPQDAFGYQFQRMERTAVLGWAIGIALIRLAFWRFPQQRYACWLLLCTFGYGLPVMLFYRFGINSFPESRRYALEFELCLLLLAVEVLRALFASPRPSLRWTARFALLALLLQQTPHVTRFVTHRYEKWLVVDKESTSEYRVASALNRLAPTGRVFATGGTRFRLNSWFDIPQVGGVFETGLKTRLPLIIAYQVRTDLGLAKDREAEESIMLLRAFGVEYVVVHGPNSEEFYRDYKNPRKFEGVLEKVWEEKDDFIYRLAPVRYAHLLHANEIPAITIQYGYQKPWYPYVNAMLDSTRPELRFQWDNARHATVTGKLPQGMHVAFAIPWDPNFRAYVNGTAIPLRANSTGLMVTDALPADGTRLELRFEPSIEEITCAAVSLLTAVACLGVIFWKRKA
ncbi:MAG: hypothetical protein JNM66_02715 [Bryobacterales bacterium]|nr:hypothetical protein [Bryobacterales bacterium]